MDAITGRILLKPGREKPVINRHPWLFSGAIQQIEGAPEPGDLTAVCDSNGRFLATAYFNPHSQIRARLLTWDKQKKIDPDFWRQRLSRALNHRQTLEFEPETTAYRLISAEADGLPGLIVDKYDDTLVMQCLTTGIDRRKKLLANILAELLNPTGILERSDVDVRRKENLPLVSGLLWGQVAVNNLIIMENGLQFFVDLTTGHKTGFYLDQRDNRALVCQSRFTAGKEILNVFAYTGGFAVYAAAAGAQSITNIDVSIPALELAEQNLALNNLERPSDEYIAGDAFEVLRYFRDNQRQFDVIIMDPPKFAHSQRDIKNAARGYKDLNWLALRLLRPGGLLATFSCSGLVTPDLFQKILFGAALDAQRKVQIMHFMTQGADHPIEITFPESAYLKGFLCSVW